MLQIETEMEKAAVIKVIGVGGGGCNAELRCQPRLLHQVLHYKFRHGTAADIAVADK